MENKTLDMLMDAMEKTKAKFDEAVQANEPFAASTYGHELTEMAKAVLEHKRAEYENRALERMFERNQESRNDKPEAQK